MGSAVALAGVAALALLGRSSSWERLEQRVSRAAQSLAARPLAVSTAVARSPHEAAATGVVLMAALALLLRERRREAARLVLAAGLAATASGTLKRLLARPRPPAKLRLRPVEHSGRFPSGHTTSAAVAALAVSRGLAGTGRIRIAGTAAAAAVALGVGASRVHLGEHYASDVLASYGLVLAAGLAVPPPGRCRG